MIKGNLTVILAGFALAIPLAHHIITTAIKNKSPGYQPTNKEQAGLKLMLICKSAIYKPEGGFYWYVKPEKGEAMQTELKDFQVCNLLAANLIEAESTTKAQLTAKGKKAAKR